MIHNARGKTKQCFQCPVLINKINVSQMLNLNPVLEMLEFILIETETLDIMWWV
jgi:hypothetical protein